MRCYLTREIAPVCLALETGRHELFSLPLVARFDSCFFDICRARFAISNQPTFPSCESLFICYLGEEKYFHCHFGNSPEIAANLVVESLRTVVCGEYENTTENTTNVSVERERVFKHLYYENLLTFSFQLCSL